MERDPIHQLGESIAEEELNEELAHHQELVKERASLLKTKTEEVATLLDRHLEEVKNDFNVAFSLLNNWFEQQSKENREKVQTFFKKASDVILSDEILNRTEDLDATYQEILGVDDDLMQILYTIGYDEQKKGNFAKARAIYRLLIFLNPFQENSWISLGYSFLNLNQFEEAEFAFQSASQIDPENPSGAYFLSLNFLSQNDLKQAQEFCDKGLALAANYPDKEWQQVLSSLKQSITEGGS